LAVSQFVANELERRGIPKNKIDVVYDSVQPDFTPAVWHSPNPAVALASFDPAKGRDLVEKAAQIANCPVVYSDDLPKDLTSASIFLYISRAEGLGSAAILAMAMGVPVIASDIGGLPEVLAHGQAGLLVPNNPFKIAGAISQLREDSRLAQTLIERGKQQVAELFTANRMIELTLASYRRVLAA
jgi:glycosyltransferase involved in cell wall biosynthesis